MAYDEATESGGGGYEFLCEEDVARGSVAARVGLLVEDEDTMDSARRRVPDDSVLRRSSFDEDELSLLPVNLLHILKAGRGCV